MAAQVEGDGSPDAAQPFLVGGPLTVRPAQGVDEQDGGLTFTDLAKPNAPGRCIHPCDPRCIHGHSRPIPFHPRALADQRGREHTGSAGPGATGRFPGVPDVITFVSTRRRKEAAMTRDTTIRAIGNSAGTTIPKAMLERYHLSEGDPVHLVELEDGILITPFDPDFEEALEIYEEGAKRYRNAMRELAE